MYLLTLNQRQDNGAYAVLNRYGEKVLFMFEDEDDAERYKLMLESDEDSEMNVIEIDEKLAIQTCYSYNYRYVIIKPDDFVVPPIDYDNIQTDKMA